ncbi:class I SAM-dependent RNA methyltransferase [Prosthecobacter sp.]|uniref:class I SAM-dependent RNA methyltransferase n=1 Tax=Prosthecobacter sp. TaxID=1965333 RepID=UPI002AB93B6F|nr:class I SAM-dependent RNA methyltransferase [Prosthecobacter sp.]MDZ4401554.1 class I SAM-dependent RNA methyltransferase [Prosthecobacter sp.]
MEPPRKFNPHPFAYHQELDVRIDNLTNEGAGVARVDGWVVFVPFTLAGELVKCRVFRNHKNYSEADLMEVLEPAPNRVTPKCALFGQCGGCQYQHLAYAEQLQSKQRQVAELLKHMAKIEHPVREVIPSPVEYGYRSKITPHFHRPKSGGIGAIGFLRARTRNAMVDVEHCPIAMPELNAQLAAVRERARANSDTFKNGATLLMRAAKNGVLTRSDEIAIEDVDGVRFEFQAGDFFQNNPFILPKFVRHAIDEAKATGARHLVDAYCGSGLFAISAARDFEQVIGVEISESAVKKAAHNAEINSLTNCRFIAADAQHVFKDVPQAGADTVVLIDPPRAGCSPEFLQQLFAFGPKGVVYVSCNPATQMRDLVLFTEAGYKLGTVQPFDLFPQTKHLECVMTLSR